MTAVKICGLSTLEDALVALESGADMLGFVFAPSRRTVSVDSAAAIVEGCRRLFPRETSGWNAVGVFANQPLGEVQAAVRACGLDIVQLSGSEPPEYCRQVELPLFRAVHIGEKEPPTPEQMERLRRECRAERLLLDSGGAGRWGGTGERFAWDAVGSAAAGCLVAGGLTPDNVASAIALLHPWGVDVSSGVETDGRKDPVLIRRFIATARGEGERHGSVGRQRDYALTLALSQRERGLETPPSPRRSSIRVAPGEGPTIPSPSGRGLG